MTEFIRYLASEFSRKFTRNSPANTVSSIISKKSENSSINKNGRNKSKSNKLNLGRAYNTKSSSIHIAHLHCNHDKNNNHNSDNIKKNDKKLSNNIIINNEINNDQYLSGDNYYFFDSENEEKKNYVANDEHHYFDKNEIKNNGFEKRDIDTISVDSTLTTLTTITSTTMNTFNRSPFLNHESFWGHRYNLNTSKIRREEKIQESPDSIAYYLDSPLINSENTNKKVNKQEFYKYADNFDKYLQDSTSYLNYIKSQHSDSHQYDYQSDSQNSISHGSNLD